MTFALTHFFHAHTHALALWTAGTKHATEDFVTVEAYIPDCGDFTLRAQRYGATGNYQVQPCRENKLFYSCLKDTLGENTSYITLANGTWVQCVGPRSVDLEEVHGITFCLVTGPAAPASGGGGGGAAGGGSGRR